MRTHFLQIYLLSQSANALYDGHGEMMSSVTKFTTEASVLRSWAG